MFIKNRQGRLGKKGKARNTICNCKFICTYEICL